MKMAKPVVSMNTAEDGVIWEERQAEEVVGDAEKVIVGESSASRGFSLRSSKDSSCLIGGDSPLGRIPAYGMKRTISGGFRKMFTRWLKEEEEVSLRSRTPEEK